VSPLGFTFLGLGAGGVAVGMFHLITHACFKALLFLGAGSVIHGCHGEQDIRRMGGLRGKMPVTFVTYAIGMLALAGLPGLAGFWSKDEILHAAVAWPVSQGPFWLALFGAGLTAFYMTRQVVLVFLGESRAGHETARHGTAPHESPAVMTVPLMVLAVFAVGLGWMGTPWWPGFQHFLGGGGEGAGHAGSAWGVMLVSTLVAGAGLALGWWVYGRRPMRDAEAHDPLELWQPGVFGLLRRRLLVDELYDVTVVRWTRGFGRLCVWVDEMVWGVLVAAVSYLFVGLAWVNRLLDDYLINPAFELGCRRLRDEGGRLARLQDGRVQNSMRALGLAFAVLLLLLTWGCAE
jgi:NADH-quinone oxidoreductase subunit L